MARAADLTDSNTDSVSRTSEFRADSLLASPSPFRAESRQTSIARNSRINCSTSTALGPPADRLRSSVGPSSHSVASAPRVASKPTTRGVLHPSEPSLPRTAASVAIVFCTTLPGEEPGAIFTAITFPPPSMTL